VSSINQKNILTKTMKIFKKYKWVSVLLVLLNVANVKSEPVSMATAATVAAVIAGAELLRQTVADSKGEINIDSELWKYNRRIFTSYKGVNITQTWITEIDQYGKTARYKYTCSSPQFTEKQTIINTNQFDLRMFGSELFGDVPLEVRQFKCSYSYPSPDEPGQVYTYENDTDFRLRVKLKYIKTPYFPKSTYTVAALLSGWTREQADCSPNSTYFRSNEYFSAPIPANGTGEIIVKSKKVESFILNLSSGSGSGVGCIIWD